jgi:hypothetical protein
MIFLWFFLAFLVLMVLNFGSRHVNEEDDSGHSHSDPDYPMNEGEEGGEGDDNEVDSGKASLTPLWSMSQNLRRVEVVEPLSFYAHMVVVQENLIAVHTPV